MPASAHILLCALNWGLGHAARCIPIARELQKQGAKIFLASDGESLQLFRREFPEAKCFELPAYLPQYGSRGSFELEMALQIPKFLKAIQAEKKVCAQICAEQNIDAILSDNRWGCHHSNVPSVFLTHQLFIRLKGKLGFAEKLLWQWQKFLLRSFQELWIPDWSDHRSLSADLSKNSRLHFKQKMRHLGPLSRLNSDNKSETPYDLLLLLSGPEPQRTHFESLLLEAMVDINKKSILVRGTEHAPPLFSPPAHIEVRDLLTGESLELLLNSAYFVVARSGYSTIMDLCKLQKPALLIPTHGQTEQEYLGERLSKLGFCFSQSQEKLDIEKALSEVESLKGFPALENDHLLEKEITAFLTEL